MILPIRKVDIPLKILSLIEPLGKVIQCTQVPNNTHANGKKQKGQELPQKHREAYKEVNCIKQGPDCIHGCSVHKFVIWELHI